MATERDEEDVSSAHGNGCESCCHRRFPDGGHCYMFKEEPEVCFAHKYGREFVEQTIENVSPLPAQAGGAPVTPSALESALAKLRMKPGKVCTILGNDESAALLARLEAQQWRPIETAPKGGTEFQGWLWSDMYRTGWWEPRCRYSADGAFQVWQRVDYDDDGWDVVEARPTHWLPKPTEPAAYRNPQPAGGGE